MFDYLKMADQELKPYAEKARIALLAVWGVTLVLTGVMWLINIAGWAGANFVFVIISMPMILFAALSPKVILTFLGLKVLTGDGEKALAKSLLVILYTFGFLATVLATWSFEKSPGAFWGLFAIAQMLLMWQLVYGEKSDLSKKLQLAYLVISGILIVLSTTGISTKVTEWYNESDTTSVLEAGAEETTSGCPAEVYVIPAEGMAITVLPCMESVTFVVPDTTIGFRNFLPGATPAEIMEGSWTNHFVQGPRVGNTESLFLREELEAPLTIFVDPFTSEEQNAERIRKAMAGLL